MEQQQFEAMLHDAEVRLRRLKQLYDQYFAGIERVEPMVARKEVDDLLARLRREQIRNTALRFRLQQVVQRHTTFTTYWRRISRQIEEGTYQRDVTKAKRLRAQLEAERDGTDVSYDVDVDLDVDLDVGAALAEATQMANAAAGSVASKKSSTPAPARALEAAGQASSLHPNPLAAVPTPSLPARPAPPSGASESTAKRPPPVPAAAAAQKPISPFALPLSEAEGAAARSSAAPPKPPLPPAPRTQPLTQPLTQPAGVAKPAASAGAPKKPESASGGLSQDDVQRIYAKYVAARASNAERTDNVKLENIDKTLRGMMPELSKKHAGKRIDFEVVVKDGKVALKPVAK